MKTRSRAILLLYMVNLFTLTLFSQTSSWIPKTGSFWQWTSNSSDVFLSLAGTTTTANDMMIVNKSSGHFSLYKYYWSNTAPDTGWGWHKYLDNTPWTPYLDNIQNWHITTNDDYKIINRPGNRSYIVAINKSGTYASVQQLNINGSTYYWSQIWGTSNGDIAGWHFQTTDKYVTGNFDNSTGDDEMLCVHPNNYVALLQFNGSSWSSLYGNAGNGNIGGQWSVGSYDSYIALDYDGDGKDELLCVSLSLSKILSYSSGSWSTVWTSSGATIGTYGINGYDLYLSGKFTETGSKDQLFISNYNSPSALLMEFNGSSWSELWNNGSTQSISGLSWTMSGGDVFIAPERYIVCTNGSTYKTGASNYNPTAPQNIAIASYGGTRFTPGHPKISWDGSSESDMNESGAVYEIYRNTSSPAATYLATVSYSTHEYIDNAVDVGTGGQTLYYRVRAKDSFGLYSQYSTQVNIQSSNWQSKQQGGPIVTNAVPQEYALHQNYPNPFNPTTNIEYSVLEQGHVSISVYDLLGRKVSDVVNEYQSAGNYSVNFNANALPSGTYTYVLNVNGYSETKRMMLLK